MAKRPRKSTKKSPPAPPPSLPPDDNDERPEYYASQVTVLKCSPANFDQADGEPATTITVARRGDIEPLVITMRDTRALAAQLLVSLATYDDEFARKLLDDHFPADAEGQFHWPADGGVR